MIQDTSTRSLRDGAADGGDAPLHLGKASVETRGAFGTEPEIVGQLPNMAVFQD